MLLTITTTHSPATDLGFLLHKHPARLQEVELTQGKAHIFYTEATEERCTCALLLDIDPVGLVRNSKGTSGNAFALEQYVNDRPYVASSFMSTAISKAFSSALNGHCKNRPELVDIPISLEVGISVLPARGRADLLERLFAPLGYTIQQERHMLDPHFPAWGMSPYHTVTLSNTLTVQQVLSHIFVLIPVLDNDKHYWVNKEEVDKLLDKGKGWLETHPDKELIVHRYLKYQKKMAATALDMLGEENDEETDAAEEQEDSHKVRLHDVRLQAVHEALIASGATTVADLGCGEGRLLALLVRDHRFAKILGMDVSVRSLEIAADKLRLDRLPERQKERIKLIQGALTYRDSRIAGYDAVALVEVIEHLEEDRLPALERVVFHFAAPGTVVVTTPNKEWNVTFTEEQEKMRHSDHRFEWTRQQFAHWCLHIEEQYGYSYTIKPVGEEAEGVGAPSQMAVFTKA